MTALHKDLELGRWSQMAFAEQMSHIGSEISRAITWRSKQREVFFQKAFARALELHSLSMECAHSWPQRKELARLKEVLLDDFLGQNTFGSTDELWQKYFNYFNRLVRS